MKEHAVVFMDTENAFFFARRAGRTQGITKHHEASARALDQQAAYFEVATRGPAVFRRLCAWLEAEYKFAGRSYGKGKAPGVDAVVDAVIAREWVHVLVHRGEDVADDALVEDLALRVGCGQGEMTAMVVVTSDANLLERVGRLVRDSPLDVVAVLGPRRLATALFDIGGRLDPIRLGTTIPRLYAQMVDDEKERAAAADYVAAYHPRDLLTRGHIRDRLLTSPDLAELERRTGELIEAASERALVDDRYERLLWIQEHAEDRRRSLTRPLAIPSETDLEILVVTVDGFLRRE